MSRLSWAYSLCSCMFLFPNVKPFNALYSILPMVSSTHSSQNITQQHFLCNLYCRSAVNVNNIILLIRRLWHLIILNYYQRVENLYKHFFAVDCFFYINFFSMMFTLKVIPMDHQFFERQWCNKRCYRIQFPIKFCKATGTVAAFFSSLVQLPSSDLLMDRSLFPPFISFYHRLLIH